MAIDRAVWIAMRPRSDRRVHVHSLDLGGASTFELDGLERGDEGWDEYLKGVAWSLQEDGLSLGGWEGVVTGDVPVGAGLSSSAALELATARAFQAVSDFRWNAVRMAQLSQRAENDWVGMKCGIMDQLISAAGQTGHALLIDCRSLELHPVPLPRGTAVVVLDTSTRRGLVDSAYNERREQCEEAARFFGVPALRDVDFEQFQESAGQLTEVTCKRARHIISENRRTLEAAEAMKAGDADRLGRLMNESHLSLRDDFEVSSESLDAMVDCAQALDGCYGARMTGAGFGGCAVALVAEAGAQAFVDRVASCYQTSSSHKPSIYICQATEGAAVID
jgi:galactokinase